MSELFSQFVERRGELLDLTIEHMEMTSMAALLSLVVGVLIGIAITKNEKAAAVVIGIANLMQSIPSIGLLAFMVPFVGIGQKPAIIMVVIYALLPIIKNTYTGITGIDPKLLEAASGIGLSKSQQLLRIQLPLALPFIMAGVRISAVTAVGTVTIAAFAGAGGLGWMINMGLNANDANLVMLGAIPACLLALVVDFVLGKVEKAITPEGLKPAEKIVYMPRSKRVMKQAVAMALCALLLIAPPLNVLVRTLTDNDDRLVVGAQNFTEGMILGDIYVELIETKTDIPVERVYNLTSLMITLPALENGSIDMVTDYTGMLAPQALDLPMDTNPERVYENVRTGMKEQYDLEVSQPLGFSNTYVLAVSPETAEAYDISTLSQLLRQAPSLRLGATTSFLIRDDLLPRLKSEHGVQFKEERGLDGNVRYQAILAGEVEVTDAYETDAVLEKTGLVTMQDDMEFFPPYQCVNLVRSDVYERYPELRDILPLLDNAITTEEMRKMNYKVDVEGMTTQEVAHEFLVEKGLI